MTGVRPLAGIPDAAAQVFAPSFTAARERFLMEVERRGGLRRSYVNPNQGPNGEELATDTAWLGDEAAADVLVLLSGTHGVEGFCGSGCQLDAMRSGILDALPSSTAVLMVHAINPYGFAWLRRVTEENVDLNRNFIDFADPPANSHYLEIAGDLVPASAEPAALAAARERLAAWRARHGDRAYQLAYGGGQYTHPDGIFFGGHAATWARRTTELLIADWGLAARRQVAVIDYHTGLGPYGYGEPITGHHPGSDPAERLKTWIGESLTEPQRGASVTVPKQGLNRYGWARKIGDPLTFVTLEYGTYPYEGSLGSVQREQVLQRLGIVDWSNPDVAAAKAALKRYFFPDKQDWREQVLFRSRQIIAQILAGLSGTPIAAGQPAT